MFLLISRKGDKTMLKRLFTYKNIIFLILVGILLIILPKMLNILLLFFGAYVIACALNPFVNILERKIGRNLASIIAVLLSCFAIFTLFIPILVTTVKEVKIFLLNLPAKISALIIYLNSTKVFGRKLTEFISFDNILQNKTTIAGNLVNQSWNVTLSLFELTIIAVALMMIVYYLLADKTYLQSKFIEFFPQNLKQKAGEILKTISSKVGGYVSAQILSMLAVGIMTTIFLIFMKIDYAVLLGLVTGLLDIIPIAGPTIALCIILLLATPFGIGKGLLIVALFITVQQLSNYVVRPLVFSKWMELHPLMVFLALFFAQQFLGFWGVILSPAIAATVCVLINELYLKPINEVGSQEENND